MISPSYLFNRIKDVKLSDYMSAFPMIAALLLRPFYKKKYRDAWLICEEPAEARDNGYHFFKYMCEKQPQQKCFYAIKKQSVDAEKVIQIGETIGYGSIQHWIAYFLCKYNISSQKGGKPNAALCAFMEMNGLFKKKNVFLQHGVIINDLKWLYADRSSIHYFITSTLDETEFITNNFGYPHGTVVCTGLPRFDALHDNITNNNQIIIMPTWRYWFNLKSKQNNETDKEFSDSEYYLKWMELLQSDEIKNLKSQGVIFYFYLHRNLQRFRHYFERLDDVIVASWEDYDIQFLLKSSVAMITDYSSVFFDMVYMKKPIIFYQFDEKRYRKFQYEKGYFDYSSNPFAKCCYTSSEVTRELKQLFSKGFSVDNLYLAEHKRLFKHYDTNNCERIYKLLSSEISKDMIFD